MTENVCLAARQLAGIPNFWPIESSPEGVEYCWSAKDPDILLSFALDRHETLEMEIKLQALIRSEFLGNMQILVDDHHLSYAVRRGAPLTIIKLTLPPRDVQGPTKLRIRLPGTLSPAELGTGSDIRKLGIAISEIGVFRQAGMLARFWRHLRTKLGVPAPVGILLLTSAPRLNESTTPGIQSIMDMNSHLTLENLLVEIDEEVRRQKTRLRSA
jgi:hypothetical protein